MPDLPDNVREKDRDRNDPRNPYPRSEELAAMLRQKQGDGDRKSERQRGMLILQPQPGEHSEP